MSATTGKAGHPVVAAKTPDILANGGSQRILEALGALAVAAGARILEHYAAAKEARAKQDGSPVTDADEAAEALILEALPALLPGIPVVSEEAAAAGIMPQCGGRFVLVDPLDGTREYVSRNGEFTVNIAVIDRKRPVLGVVYAPVSGKLWLGDVVAGRAEAMMIEAGHPLSDARERQVIHARTRPSDGMVAFVSRSHCDPKTNEFLAQHALKERREAGSSFKFCLIAEGEADLYPRFSPTMQWDTAAGHAVLKAAGGSVTCPDGSPLPYGRSSDGFRNGAFVAWGAGKRPGRTG
jgi:3'(2'), 5'-bisphosphate nucleotidase